MVRRTLWNEQLDGEPILRKSLFKTTCKIEGKCCKVFIDRGSFDNLASKELVYKMKLKRLRHPTLITLLG